MIENVKVCNARASWFEISGSAMILIDNVGQIGSLGKGEVESSILSSSTITPPLQLSRSVAAPACCSVVQHSPHEVFPISCRAFFLFDFHRLSFV